MVIDISKIKKEAEKPKEPDLKKFEVKTLLDKIKTIGTISSKDKIFFVQNLQVMIRSGLPLDRSLKTLAEQTSNMRFKKIISNLASDTEKGISFGVSLAKHRKVFGDLFINMVEAGEVSGRLEDVLKQIYIQIKKMHELKTRIISAMTYPVIVTVAMVLIGIGMMIFVVPKITGLFDKMSADLPVATRFLINISNFIVNNGILSAIAAISAIVFVVVTLRMKKTKFIYHYIFLRIPIFGPIVKKVNLAKFSRTLSSLIITDIPIVKSFEITAQILGNLWYRQSLLDSVENVKGGESLTDVLKKYPKYYPPVIVQMTAAGEETGTVDEVLGELASFYEDEIDQINQFLY